MNYNWSQFIGIPYKVGGTTFENVDCIGLCQLVYQTYGWSPEKWTDGNPIDEDWYEKNPYRLVFALRNHFIPTKDKKLLNIGDIVYLSINGEGHVSVYIGYDRILSIMPPQHALYGGVSFIDRLSYYEDKFKFMYFRRKENVK